jgi:hypothetical protein
MRTPSAALIVASIALFVALGGTSYAVTQLPKNSVGTKQLKANAVTGAKVKNGSLAATDFSNAALDVLQGAAGPTGAIGATGPSNVYFGYQTTTVTVDSTTGVTVGTMDVPAGSYSVVAAMTLNNNSDYTNVAAASCGLTYGDRTAYQAADLAPQALTRSIDGSLELTLLVANTSTAAGPITVTCTCSNEHVLREGTFDVTGLRIIATQTGNLTTIATN